MADTTASEWAIRAELIAAGLVDETSGWTAFSGGRTNRIWRVGSGPGALVCKLFSENGGTELFPNDFGAEATALRALGSTGLVPELVAEVATSYGPCLLYRHVDGHRWTTATDAIADTLRSVHAFPPPEGLRRIASGPEAILAQGDRVLKACKTARVAEIIGKRPGILELPAAEPALLHGDVVPANIISSGNRAILIDWQCPAIGDPCEDLATFLSPAMQTLYGDGPLTSHQENEFLSRYGNPALTDRLRLLRRHFHWRMAAHCLWKLEREETDYESGLVLELAALEKL